MEARWNDPLSDPGVAKAKREEHELRVDTAGLLMEAAEADPAMVRFHRSLLPFGHETRRFQPPGHRAGQLSREPLGGENLFVGHVLESSISLPRPREEVFPFFADPFNLERITPPHLCFRILSTAPIRMEPGTHIDYRMSLFRVSFSWTSVISEWDPPSRFVDQQIRGPYGSWVHTHEFVDERSATLIRDRVEYDLPMWPFGELVYPLVRYELDRIFRFRSDSIHDILLADTAPKAAARRLTR